MGGRDDVIGTRIRVPCESVGFPPPPATVHLRLSAKGGRCELVAHASPPTFARAASWLAGLLPRSLDLAPGGSSILTARFERAPAAWSRLGAPPARDVVLYPDGSGVVHLEGPRTEVRAFARDVLSAAGSAARVVSVARTPGPPTILTPGQHAAITAAVAEGYYEIPRRIPLRTLAFKLGTGHAALSERLRRAEARLARAYVADTVGTPPPAAPTRPDDGRDAPAPPPSVS